MQFEWNTEKELISEEIERNSKKQFKLPERISRERMTAFVMLQFGTLIAENFPGLTTLNELIYSLNNVCTGYQHDANKTLNASIIHEDWKLNCISASFIMGLWWKMSGEQIEPIYLVKRKGGLKSELFNANGGNEELAANRVHNWLVMPSGSEPRYLQGWPRISGDDDSFHITDMPENLLQSSLNHSRFIPSTPTFFAERISAVKPNNAVRHSAKENLNSYGHLVNNYSGMLTTLREMYIGARSSF